MDHTPQGAAGSSEGTWSPAHGFAQDVRLVARVGALIIVVSIVAHLLPGSERNPPVVVQVGLTVAGVLLAVGMYIAPWQRWAMHGWAERWVTAMMLLGVASTSVFVFTGGGGASRYVWMYAVILLFSGVLLRTPHLSWLTAASLVAYVMAAWAAPEPILPAEIVYRAALMALMGGMARLMAYRWRGAAGLARQHARALSVVAEAGRSIPRLDPDDVLDEVAGQAASLGYDLVGIYVEAGDGTLRYAATRGIPEALQTTRFPREGGVVGEVLRTARTCVVADYQNSEVAHDRYRSDGLRAAIGTPVFSRGELVGVLVGGTFAPRSFASFDIEAFELLAGIAGRALETASAFRAQLQVNDQLRDLDRAKSDFVSIVSHELRTPLTVILGMADTLVGRWDELSDELHRDLVGRLQHNARALEQVLSTLLDLARLESGQLETRFDRFDLRTLVLATHDRLRPLFDRHQVELDLPTSLTVHGDERLLERVVENLLSNAARHTPAGTHVRVTARTSPSRTTLEIADNGPGIAPEDLERIGQRFVRGGDPNRRTTRGVGLGLALSVEVLRLHGSQLTVRSDAGSGTVFSFDVPRVPAHAVNPASAVT